MLDNIKSTTAAGAAGGFRGIGHNLQLVEDKARNDKRAFEKPGGNNVGNAAID